MNITAKLEAVTGRLVNKINMSQTPVPGFIIGLSGTDSIIAFEILSRALSDVGMPHRIHGIHYVDPNKKIGNFAREAMPWLKTRHPMARFTIAQPLGGNQDPQRWADLQLRAMHEVSGTVDKPSLHLLDPADQFWVSGTINATENILGTHSIAATGVSIQPIRSLWKTDVLTACEAINVPRSVIEAARIPDCFCGRDEIAAQNIELIDQLLRYDVTITDHDPELVNMLMAWISVQKRENGFRQRIPYIV